jgi:hypothetical protein
MPKATLLVRRKGTAMVQNYETGAQVRRFHGWKHDPTAGEEFSDPNDHGKVKAQGAFVGHDADIAVPNTVDYRRAVADGDLWPANQETAQECGVPFDSTFGEAPEPKPALVSLSASTPTSVAPAAEEH